MIERAEWLKQMRDMTEVLYDHVAPAYWGNFGLYENEAHQDYLRKFIQAGLTIEEKGIGNGYHHYVVRRE